jgi:hypothetical protein
VLEHDRRRRGGGEDVVAQAGGGRELAAVRWGEAPHAVGLVWVVGRPPKPDSSRYPEVFASRFPGSSLAWLRALSAARRPREPGSWCSVDGSRLFAWRRRA